MFEKEAEEAGLERNCTSKGDRRKMNMQKLLIYTKEELITYILRHRFFDKNIEEEMQGIRREFLL